MSSEKENDFIETAESGGEPEKAVNLHKGHRQRLRRQYLDSGRHAFNEHQLVEMLLFYVLPQKDTNEIAHRLVNEAGGLAGIFTEYSEFTGEQLKKIGLSANSMMFFKLIAELYTKKFPYHRRSCKQIFTDADGIDTVNYLHTHFKIKLKAEREKCFSAAVFSNDLALVHTEVLYRQGDSRGNDIVRNATKLAVTENAAMAAAAWKIPDDAAAPSAVDRMLFERLKNIYGSIGVYFIDYLIIGERNYFSFRRSFPEEFEDY